MDITVASAPPPGTAAPGNLYIDTASRQMWLGVDPAVDPAQALLVSDIIQLEADITAALAAAKTYTDNVVRGDSGAPVDPKGYSGRLHTHTASQITDFTAAVTNVATNIPGANWVRGMIMMWSGSLAEIGQGNLAGWALCDGSNGTPNLRDKFIMGAGNVLPNVANPAASINTSDDGQHTHAIAAMTLTLAQVPSHTHSFSASGSTGTESQAHTHGFSYLSPEFSAGRAGGGFNTAGTTQTLSGTTGQEQTNHSHAFSVSGTSGAAGSGGAHTHTAAQDGVHHHNVTSQQLRDALPYLALAYIMKL